MNMDFKNFGTHALAKMMGEWERVGADAMFGMSFQEKGDAHDVGAVIPTDVLNEILRECEVGGDTLIRVQSAFSGFGLYRTSSIMKHNARYDGQYPHNVRSSNHPWGQIEHIAFNMELEQLWVYPPFQPTYS